MTTDIVIPKKEVYMKFKGIFGIGLEYFKDALIMMISRRFEFDIIGFDDYMHKFQGYNEEKYRSLNDFVKMKYGDNAVKLIKDLINF